MKYRQGDRALSIEYHDADIVAIMPPNRVFAADNFNVIEAHYGWEWPYIDVSKKLRELTKKGQLEVRIGSGALEVTDPRPGVKKEVYVVYQWRGKMQYAQAWDNETLRLPPK